MATTEEEKSALSPRQCTVSQVDCNNGKIIWIALRIGSAPTLFSRSSPQWLLAVCRPLKNAPERERDLAPMKKCIEVKNKAFYKKDIEFLGKWWNQCITLEGDYVDD